MTLCRLTVTSMWIYVSNGTYILDPNPRFEVGSVRIRIEEVFHYADPCASGFCGTTFLSNI